MQANYSNINDLFSGTGSYPLENLSKDNRWVKLADALDWKFIEEEYNNRLSNHRRGACNKPARMVIGAMLIKHTLCCSDEGTYHQHSEESLYCSILLVWSISRRLPSSAQNFLWHYASELMISSLMTSCFPYTRTAWKSLVHLPQSIQTKVILEPLVTVIRQDLLW